MAESSDENSMDHKSKVPPGPIVHVRADSDSTLEALFDIALKPPGTQTPLQVPLRMRNLPASFFKPPMSGGSRSPSCHSRENSLDSSNLSQQQQQQPQLQQPYSPGQQSVGSPQPSAPQPVHSRAHSSPATLQQTLAAAQQQSQHLHLRQPSCDVTQSPADLGPLPPGWEPARTPQGQLYFMNHITKTTQWEDPRHQIRQQQIKEEQLNQLTNGRNVPQTQQEKLQVLSRALPQGWEQGVTPEGEVYFINHISKTTTWFDPRIPIANQTVPIRIGQQQAQQQQQQLRLQRLENERKVLQQRQVELKEFLNKQEQARLERQINLRQHDTMQAAVNATQEMLMRQNLNDSCTSPQGQQQQQRLDPFLGSSAGPNEMQHVREESADSGLGLGSNFNLGSIPEDISGLETMDTDLDTTLTEQPTSTSASGGLASVLDDGSNMDSTDSLMPTLPADLGDEISNDIMQSILSNSRPGAAIDGALTWL